MRRMIQRIIRIVIAQVAKDCGVVMYVIALSPWGDCSHHIEASTNVSAL